MAVSHRGMVCAMSVSRALNNAVQYFIALYFCFFGFWFFISPSVREA